MNLLIRLGVAGAVGIFLLACGSGEAPVQPAAPAETLPASGEPAVAQIATVDELRREFRKDKYNTMSGELADGRLVNNGKGGFLLFGPYIAFQAGTYSVSFVGSIDELPTDKKVRIDAVSNQGKTSHAMTELDTEGSIQSFELTLIEPVQDLEVRVLAPEGAMVSLESYQVARLR